MNRDCNTGSRFLFQPGDAEGQGEPAGQALSGRGFGVPAATQGEAASIPAASLELQPISNLPSDTLLFLSTQIPGLLPLYTNEEKRLDHPGLCD